MNTITLPQRQYSRSIETLSPVRRLGGAIAAAPVTLLLAAFAIAVQAVPRGAEWLQFNRAAIASGEWWRVFSGHLTHWNANHLFWDAAMFVLLGVLCERHGTARYYTCLLLSAVVISAALWWRMPALELYRGLSGIDSALFALAGMLLLREARLRQQRMWGAMLAALLLGLIGKVAYEYITGTTIFVEADPQFIPLPMVHLVGAVLGLLVALKLWAATA